MEEKTTAPGTPASGCFFCATALPLLERLWPPDTCQHFRNAHVEFLKGVRSLIDQRIGQLSGAESKGTHVTVE